MCGRGEIRNFAGRQRGLDGLRRMVSRHRKQADMAKRIATIGFFDGVHRGHRFLIRQMLRWGEERRLNPLTITFDRHPRQVLSEDYVPRLLTTLPEKLELLRMAGATDIEVLPFTPELGRLTALDFMRNVLAERLNVAVLVMGYDHRFGHGGGTPEEYVEWGRQCGIEVGMAKPLPEEKVSSSLIRRELEKGNLAAAIRMLGHPYWLSGRVIGGHQMGRRLGFPTANIAVADEKLLPACGVYAARTQLPDGTTYKSVLNIGARPTLHNGDDVSVEAHLLDFIGDLYARELRVEVVERLREERVFDDTEVLGRQIAEDCAAAREILDAR